jgi:hypothetical protein
MKTITEMEYNTAHMTKQEWAYMMLHIDKASDNIRAIMKQQHGSPFEYEADFKRHTKADLERYEALLMKYGKTCGFSRHDW